VIETICVYLCLPVISLSFALPVLAAVDGVVINKTVGKPQAGATVTLYKLGQAGMESLESVKSDAQGKFAIDQPVNGPHLIQTAYDGVTYNHILAPGSATSGLSLDVYNSSKRPGAAHVLRHFMIFQPSGAQMIVSEGFTFQNNGLITYNDPDGGTLKVYVPPAAKGAVQVKATAPQGMPIDRAAEKTDQPDVYKIDFPIKPGETNFEVSYAVPYSSGEVYEGKVLYKTDQPTLLVAPSGITLKGDGLESKGREPRTQASVFSVASPDFKVEIAGSLAAADTDSGDSGPGIEEIPPKILQKNTIWILALALGILALGFIVLYRAQEPAGAPEVAAAKGTHARGRR
jgi:uncharacterized Zn-binding protein involved in type VI secretion